MSKFDLRGRGAVAVLAALALSVGAAACGDDDDSSSDPSEVAIEVSGGKDGVEITAPSEADAGPAEITLTNNSEGDADGQLVFVAEGEDHSDEEVISELGNAITGKPVADWFQAAGGPGSVAAGESSTATVLLEPGTYYVPPSDDGNAPPKELTKFTVSGDSDGELPDADGTIDAAEYSFTGDDLKAGEQTLLLENKGGTWHHFLSAKLKDDATIEDAQKFFESEQGEPPFVSEDGNGAISSTVIDGGKSMLVDANLEAGKYVFFCFVSDKQTGGPPHVAKGMVSEVEVSE